MDQAGWPIRIGFMRLTACPLFAAVGALMVPPADAQSQPGPWKLPEGAIIIEGDIIVPEWFPWAEGAYVTNLWPNGVVHYEFDANVVPGLVGMANPRAEMVAAMQEWENVATIDFVACANDNCAAEGRSGYLHIQNSNGNTSWVGRQGGGQVVEIFNWNFRFIMAHELGHALGYWHEQSRADRDSYIRVEYANICQNCCRGSPCDHNFNIRSSGGEYGPYDFDSVMHYAQCDFSCCDAGVNPCLRGNPPADLVCSNSPSECRTITVLPPHDTAWQNAIGQRTRLSVWDAKIMSFLYPQPNWVFADLTYGGAEDGSFPRPFNTFTEGYMAMPSHGRLYLLKPGSYATSGLLTKAGQIHAPLGGVVLAR